ncbi:MAG: YciI family protein [candidate division NC10 bacterium]
MYFIILATDKPNSAHIRQEKRPAHLDYIKPFGMQIVAGGATLTDDGETMTGSFLLVDMPDRTAVEEFLRNDPYGKGGLFETVEVRRWRKVIFNPPEG